MIYQQKSFLSPSALDIAVFLKKGIVIETLIQKYKFAYIPQPFKVSMSVGLSIFKGSELYLHQHYIMLQWDLVTVTSYPYQQVLDLCNVLYLELSLKTTCKLHWFKMLHGQII